MPTASRAKHKFCRRIGQCLWGCPNCPTVKGMARAYAAGPHGKGRRAKLSTYGELLIEKQKLKNYYAISEKQLQIAYAKAKTGSGQAGDKLVISLETRLDAMLFRCGFAPTIFAAKQFANHGHILVDGKKVDRSSYQLKEGQVITVAEKSTAIQEIVKKSNAVIPPYAEVDLENCKLTMIRKPQPEEVVLPVKIMSVIEYYAR